MAVEHLALGDRLDALGGDQGRRRSRRLALTHDDVRLIRSLWASGDLSQQAIGELFGVGQSCVSNVIGRRTHAAVG